MSIKDLAFSYSEIIKQEKQDDGTLLVYGKATDDALDIDQQICDAGWLEKAMPEWFKTGGNIREQHSNIAAGVAKELNSTSDGHYISALVVDPVSVKKVETGVLKGFSIGIRAPRVVRDEKAVNGRIIDGQIVEVSLVDRPANPNAKLMLAKSDNANNLVQVEELVETIDAETVKGDNMEQEVEQDAKAVSEKPSKEELLERLKEAHKMYKEAEAMCKEMGCSDDELKAQYGESAEEETEEGSKPEAAQEEVEEAEGKKSAEHKCLECGCGDVSNSHGSADVSTAEMVSPTDTPKSTITPLPTVEEIGTVIEEEDSSSDEDLDKSAISDSTLNAIIEKAVKSATATVVSEIGAYKEAINKLETELATAKTKAVGSGPKRSAIKQPEIVQLSDLLAKAAEYRQKSAVTSDKDLARGYKELAQDFEAKASAITIK
jgi:hypothetical protein